LAWRVHDFPHMNEYDLCLGPVEGDEASPAAGANERPLSICVVFDHEESAKRAGALIEHVASGYECERQSFSFEELDPPAPGVAAARSACNSDIIVFAVRDDRRLPAHIKSWLGLCIGLRDEELEGALVVLIAEAAQTSEPGSSLLEYLATVADVGRMAFFPWQGGSNPELNPVREHWEPEEMLCGSSN
jgi:hypothetical protein